MQAINVAIGELTINVDISGCALIVLVAAIVLLIGAKKNRR